MLSAAFASRELWQIIALSLAVSLSATAAAATLGLPLGAALAICRFPGAARWSCRQCAARPAAGRGRPGALPAAVALRPAGASRAPVHAAAMVIAQSILALPIVTALGHRAAEGCWRDYGDALMDLGASRLRAIPALLAMARRRC